MNNDKILEEFDYDDGVVSFGTLTENQMKRFKRLPRHTILPSDVTLSQSFLDSNKEDHNESIVGTAQSSDNFGKENKTETKELKQNFIDDSAVFSSPNVAEFIPSTKLLDTEVVNRYMFTNSISSNESFSEYQNTSTVEGKSFSYLNVQESGVTQTNSIYNESEDCEQLSIPNAIGQSQDMSKNVNNVCILKHCSLKEEDEDADTSICNDSELGNTSDDFEDSIIVEKYSITPGKQRLYDVRLTKPLFHAKTSGTSAPFMDRIDEAVVPVPKLLNVPLKVITSMDTNFDDERCTSQLSTNNSINLDGSLEETTNQIEDVINTTEYKFDTNESINNLSNISVKTTDLNKEESIAVDLEITSMDTSVEDTKFDDELSTSKLSTKNCIDLNRSLKETTFQIEDVINITKYKFDTNESVNDLSNLSVETTDLTDYNKEESIAVDLEITPMNTSVGDTKFDDELCTSKLSTNSTYHLNKSLNETTSNIVSEISFQITDLTDFNKEESIAVDLETTSMDTSVGVTKFDDEISTSKLSTNNSMNLNKPLNETANQIEYVVNTTEYKFDTNESVNNLSNISVQTTDLTDFNKEESIVVDLEITSIDTSVEDTKFDDELSTNKLSTNNSMNLNKTLNETTNQIEDVVNITEYKFDTNESVNNLSNISVQTTDLTDFNKEESIAVDLEITSMNTSVGDTKFDDELCTSKLSTNSTYHLNKSLNETTNQIEDVVNITKYKFDTNESVNNLSNISVQTTDLTDFNKEESIAVDLEITSMNTTVGDTKFDDELCTSKLSTNNCINLIGSLNETTDQIEDVINTTEYKFDTNESVNNLSNISVQTTDLTDFNKEESIAIDLEITSMDTSVGYTKFDDELSTNKLSTNNSMYLNKPLNITTNQIEDVINTTEYMFDSKDSISNLSKISIQAADLTDFNKEEFNAVDLDITLVNTNAVTIVDTKFDANKSINDIPNITADDNFIETSQLFEVGNNTLKDISYTDDINPTCSNDISATKNSSHAMRQYLDFEQTVHEMCKETNCGNLKINDSILCDSQTRANILLAEKTEETFNTTNVDNRFSSSASPLKSNLSVIIENRTLEENSGDFMMQNEGFEKPINNMSINSALENFANENLDNIVFDNLTNLNKKKYFVAEDVSEPEVVTLSTVNEIEKNTTEMEMKSNKDVCINNSSICSKLSFVDTNDMHNNSLDKYNTNEQMFNFGELQKVSAVEINTPKTQKILDFSIVQQTPIFENQVKKQKLLNFSIVDQTPIPKSTQQMSLNESSTKTDFFIDFNSVNQVLELKTKSIDKENDQNCFYDSSLKNLSTISAPAIESFTDDSINSNKSTINQTISENNLNQSTRSYEVNKLKTNVVRNMDPIEYCINKSITDEGVKSGINCESNNFLNQNSRKLDRTPTTMNFNEQKIINSNKNIVDFSIIEKPITSELTNITSIESSCNISHLNDSCVISMTDTKPKGQLLHSSQNLLTAVTSNIKIKESFADISDYCSVDNTTALVDRSTFSHNSEPLTDVQMSDLSIFLEAEKSSACESFHSIELDHVQEFNKRKIEAVQDYRNSENKIKVVTKDPESDHLQEDNKTKIMSVHDSGKKMKVESKEPETPISMLYKIKNMFKSNEKIPHYINNSISGLPKNIKKSKIPYKVTNNPVAKLGESNNLLSVNNVLNHSIKSNKTLPKFKGSPALSDLSNKKFPGDKYSKM